jgi:hypothetical protein
MPAICRKWAAAKFWLRFDDMSGIQLGGLDESS